MQEGEGTRCHGIRKKVLNLNKTDTKRFKYCQSMVFFAILSYLGISPSHFAGMPVPDSVPDNSIPPSPASKAEEIAWVAVKPEASARKHTPPGGGVNNISLFGNFIGPDPGCHLRCMEDAALESSLPPYGIEPLVSLNSGRDNLLSMKAKAFRKFYLSGAKNIFYETFEDGHYRRAA